jgi:hypothetical protein
MNVVEAAKNTLSYVDFDPERSDDGDNPAHAVWMLNGIVDGYVQHEKAHRWLGYAQALLVCAGIISLNDAKRCNRDST